LLLLAILVIVLIDPFSGSTDTEGAKGVFETQTVSMGDIQIEITPKSLSDYRVTFNTHVVELDYDFMELFTLTDDKGNEMKPIKWTGGRGGHHLSGILLFNVLRDDTKNVILKLGKIEDNERSFKWEK